MTSKKNGAIIIPRIVFVGIDDASIPIYTHFNSYNGDNVNKDMASSLPVNAQAQYGASVTTYEIRNRKATIWNCGQLIDADSVRNASQVFLMINIDQSLEILQEKIRQFLIINREFFLSPRFPSDAKLFLVGNTIKNTLTENDSKQLEACGDYIQELTKNGTIIDTQNRTRPINKLTFTNKKIVNGNNPDDINKFMLPTFFDTPLEEILKLTPNEQLIVGYIKSNFELNHLKEITSTIKPNELNHILTNLSKDKNLADNLKKVKDDIYLQYMKNHEERQKRSWFSRAIDFIRNLPKKKEAITQVTFDAEYLNKLKAIRKDIKLLQPEISSRAKTTSKLFNSLGEFKATSKTEGKKVTLLMTNEQVKRYQILEKALALKEKDKDEEKYIAKKASFFAQYAKSQKVSNTIVTKNHAHFRK